MKLPFRHAGGRLSTQREESSMSPIASKNVKHRIKRWAKRVMRREAIDREVADNTTPDIKTIGWDANGSPTDDVDV